MTDATQAVPVCTAADLAAAGKKVVQANGEPVLLMWNNGTPIAMHDTCIHRGRSLFDGVVFSGRVVCAGHQWAFDLSTGYCKARERYQPVYPLTIDNGVVYVNVPPRIEALVDATA
jgi:nitrite reductase (NADH) small subunit